MKKNFERKSGCALASLVLMALVLLWSQAEARAQNGGTQGDAVAAATEQDASELHNNLADQLKLSPEQLEKIKGIHEQTKEERRVVNQRVRQSQRALEDAIYSENASEALIEERARELASAQTEAVRLRARTELNIRRVLSPEQLTTLRVLRQNARIRQEQRQEQRQLMNPGRARPLRDGLEKRNNNNLLAPEKQDKNMRPADGTARPGLGPRAGRRGEMQRRPRP